MTSEIVIVGTGGSGRETLCLLRDIQAVDPARWRFRGFLADQAPDRALLESLNAKYLGGPADGALLATLSGCHYVVGIGACEPRRRVSGLLDRAGLVAATLIHPAANIGMAVEIGRGSVVCAGSVVTTNVKLGESAQVNINCSIGHDGVVGDFVTFTPGVTITGNVSIGSQAYIGAGATVLPGTHIGDGALIGAGAVVVKDVRPGARVVGIPAHEID